MAIFRAVENRRFLLRAATTGVSGIIDPYGRILAESRLMTRTFLTERITPSRKMTFYTEHGDVLAWASLTLSIIFFIMRIFKKTREREDHGRKRAIY
jgi:apolipoprotein N-acyltransferase